MCVRLIIKQFTQKELLGHGYQQVKGAAIIGIAVRRFLFLCIHPKLVVMWYDLRHKVMHKVLGEIYFIGVQSSAVLASGLMSTVVIYYK